MSVKSKAADEGTVGAACETEATEGVGEEAMSEGVRVTMRIGARALIVYVRMFPNPRNPLSYHNPPGQSSIRSELPNRSKLIRKFRKMYRKKRERSL
jgi:hypothetical protein